MTVYLLDVNLLLASSDPIHIHHEMAHGWFEQVGRLAWASCPLTENAYVRIASHPGYPNRPGDAAVVLESLRRFCTLAGHHFWPEDVSLLEVIRPGATLSHGQVTDVYLLGLAARKGGKLVAFDRCIAAVMTPGGEGALELIKA